MLHSLDIGPNDWEDSVSPGGDVREVAHHRGHPVPGEHVEHLPGLQGVLASSHQNLNNVMELADRGSMSFYLVIMRSVLASQPIVGHLIQLRILRGGGIQVQEMINSR